MPHPAPLQLLRPAEPPTRSASRPLPTPAAGRTFADLERDSLALLIGWHAEREERAAIAPQPERSAPGALAALSAGVDHAISEAAR